MLMSPEGTEFFAESMQTTAPSQRLHLILLGVKDVQASTRFYESLGWQRSPTGHSGFEKFDLGGYAIALMSKKDLANDANFASDSVSDFRGTAFVYLAKSPEDVPNILAKAVAAGGALVKPATRTAWGIAGYFKDIDGHLFEVDYEQSWKFDEQHRLIVDEMNP